MCARSGDIGQRMAVRCNVWQRMATYCSVTYGHFFHQVICFLIFSASKFSHDIKNWKFDFYRMENFRSVIFIG